MQAPTLPSVFWLKHQWAQRFAVVAAINVATTLVLHLVGASDDPLHRHAIYSACIGFLIWGFIELALLVTETVLCKNAIVQATARSVFYAGPLPSHWVAVCAVIGAVLGLVLGTVMADLIIGRPPLRYWRMRPDFALGLLVLALTLGLVGTAYFTAQARAAQLREQAEAAQRLATQAHLRLLQSQLEPHMLFNTLSNVKVLVGLDAARAEAMLDKLIAFLRASLGASRLPAGACHSLADEFARLSDYLALMQMRMGQRLEFQLHLPAELATAQVPPLLLQPLVENAIQHGLEPQVAGGRLVVSASVEAGVLSLSVTDNGLGLPGTPSDHPGTGYGLAHVRERLANLHGKRASFALLAAHPQGTQALLRIPLELPA